MRHHSATLLLGLTITAGLACGAAACAVGRPPVDHRGAVPYRDSPASLENESDAPGSHTMMPPAGT